MKIRPLDPENHHKVTALLRSAFPRSSYEVRLIEKLHKNKKPMLEWVCIHTNKFIGYVAFTHAFSGTKICGLHLAPLAVSPQFQNQGIGSELLRFCLRQAVIKENAVYVLGDHKFYKKFGFEKCKQPVCPFDNNNEHFLAVRNAETNNFTVGYEPEFNVKI